MSKHKLGSKHKLAWFIGLPALILVLIAGAGLGWLLFGEQELSATAAPDMGENATFHRSGPFKVSVTVNPKTPQVGENRLIIRLRDRQGQPVPGARIKAVAKMPAMGAMPAMQAPADLEEVVPGRYEGTFELPMEGAWPLSLQIGKPGMGRTYLGFDMATGRTGLQLVAGGSGGANTMEPMQDQAPRAITVDARRRQLIGVETGKVTYRHLTRTIRAVAQVTYDRTRLSDISLRFDAWIGELKADYVGEHVKKGEVLFTVYGPELLAAQREYLQVLAHRGELTNGLVAAARKRLLLWGLTPAQIDQLERRSEPLDYVPIMASQSGTVIDKKIVEGTAHKAGTTLMRIADLSQVWVEAEIYEGDLPLVHEGMQATATLPYLPGKTFKARVDYVYPTLEADSRTGRIRLVLDNPDGMLKPHMYAEVKLEADLGRRLVVPDEAVLFAGDTRVVFLDLGGGRLKPQKIKTGQRSEDYIEVLEGLEAGDEIVTSGNFLIASETRLKTGIEQW